MESTYKKPEIEIVEVELQGVIAGSDLTQDGPTNPGMSAPRRGLFDQGDE